MKEINEMPEICYHAIFADYDDAFLYAWNNYMDIYIHITEDGEEVYEVY